MKHKVTRTVRDLREVDDFLEQTHKFGKKFYTIDLVGGESVRYQLNVRATGISRELICKLKWMIDVEPHKNGEAITAANVRNGDAPHFGWIPNNEKERLKFYPNTQHVPDEPGEHRWIDLFKCWDFKLQDSIEEVE